MVYDVLDMIYQHIMSIFCMEKENISNFGNDICSIEIVSLFFEPFFVPGSHFATAQWTSVLHDIVWGGICRDSAEICLYCHAEGHERSDQWESKDETNCHAIMSSSLACRQSEHIRTSQNFKEDVSHPMFEHHLHDYHTQYVPLQHFTKRKHYLLPVHVTGPSFWLHSLRPRHQLLLIIAFRCILWPWFHDISWFFFNFFLLQ